MIYKTLNDAIEKRGVKKSVIAKRIGISERGLRYKIDGTAPFTWEQVCKIQEIFFPDMEIKTLFSKSTNQKTA